MFPCARRRTARRTARPGSSPLQIIESPKQYDVCIVGSGAGGGLSVKGVDGTQASALLERVVFENNWAEGGTGLGLAISKRLVELMGGSISVGPSGLGGTAFTVIIPKKYNLWGNFSLLR